MQLSKLIKMDVGDKLCKASLVQTSWAHRFLFFRLHPRLPKYTKFAILVFALVGWMLYTDRNDWQEPWAQRSLPPQRLSNQDNLLPKMRPVQFAPNRRRPAFDLSTIMVPANEIHSGGPPKDGIPALTNPTFIAAGGATYLHPEDRVIGIVGANRAKAYPLKILNHHEIINDLVGDLPVAVTYCPLCDSCAIFDRRTELGLHEFGVSGLLYNSNVLMYDRGGHPESLWSQVKAQGITGPGAKKSLTALPLELTSWKDWLTRHPETLVLSSATGHRRNYGRNPYESYFSTPRLMFPVKPSNNRLPAKSRVLGVWSGLVAKAYPESYFSQGQQRIEDLLNGKKIVIEYNPEARSMRVVEAEQGVHWIYSLWFAWYAFHPETSVFGQKSYH